jgi:hypothetical protein
MHHERIYNRYQEEIAQIFERLGEILQLGWTERENPHQLDCTISNIICDEN